MTITIRLTKVEIEMLKELQKRDKRYKKGLEVQVKNAKIIRALRLAGFKISGAGTFNPNKNSLSHHLARAKERGCKFSTFNQSEKI